MRAASAILTDLLAVAGQLATKPQTFAIGAPPRLAELVVELKALDAQPQEAARVSTAAVMLAGALQQVTYTRNGEALAWSMVAGALMPMVRADLYTAFVQERAVMPS